MSWKGIVLFALYTAVIVAGMVTLVILGSMR